MPFQTLGLHPDILKGIHDLGFEKPTPIQEQAIPHVLAGHDVIASAQTGTGKTAAFVLPILHRLMTTSRRSLGIRALVLAPTRELALQSMEHLQNLSRYVPLKGLAIFGGVPMAPQVTALSRGLDIVSATPGRLLDHTYEGRIDYGSIEIFVLDEADRMMDMGFLPDVKRIISFLPPKRQNLIFSATIPPEVMQLSKTICHDPVTVQIARSNTTAAGIRHAVYPVSQTQKTDLLVRLLRKNEDMESVIVFTRTKQRADHLYKSLERAGIRTSLIHGDRSQGERLRALDYFRTGRTKVLVATDVAARGIDIKDISHVINFDVPQSPEDYVHRSGRTARAEATGDAFTLMAPEEEEDVIEIEKEIRQQLPRVTLPDFNYKKQDAHHPSHSRSHFGGAPRRGHSPSHGRHRNPGHSRH